MCFWESPLKETKVSCESLVSVTHWSFKGRISITFSQISECWWIFCNGLDKCVSKCQASDGISEEIFDDANVF